MLYYPMRYFLIIDSATVMDKRELVYNF